MPATKKHLEIKWKEGKSYDCSHSKKKKHFKQSDYPTSSKSSKSKHFHKKKKWKFVKKRKFRGKRSDKCFLYLKPGHFAKNCPKTSKKDKLLIHLMQLAPGITDSDLESVFALEDEQTPETILSIAYSDSKEEEECPSLDDSDDESQPLDVLEIFQLDDQPNNPLLEFSLAPDMPSPTAKVQIYLNHYDKPTPVIAYFDTGAACTVINPDILPSSHWEPCRQGFRAANGQSFIVNQINKPFYIQLFLGCVLRHKAFGMKLPAKDLLIGFDLVIV